MKKTKIIFSLLFLRLCLYPQAADWQLKLSSNVEIRNWKLTSKAEKEEKSLAGASIVLTKNGQMVAQTTSNANGDFTIMVPPNGDYILTVSYPGYNTKRFAVNTYNVPEDFAKNDYKPTFSIGGFIMAKAFPGIDYSGLEKPLVKVEFKQKKKVFDHDEAVTNEGLRIVTKIYNDEDALIQNFCNTNKQGDIALAKPDCPLAKMLYEKAIKIIPGEPYPVEQLAKVGQCLKDKEEADKKAAEAATAAKAKAAEEAAAKKKVEEEAAAAKAKAAAEKAASEKQAKEKAAKEKAEAEAKALAEAKEKEEQKKREAAEKEQKKKEAMAKAKAEDEAEAKAIAEKKEAERKAKEQARKDKEQKEKEAMAKAKAEDEAEAKAIAEERERKRKAKEEEEKSKQLQYQTGQDENEAVKSKGNSKYGVYQVLGADNKYREQIKKADDYFKMKRYSEAKPVYEDALKLKPDDPYAKAKLEEIEKLLKKE